MVVLPVLYALVSAPLQAEIQGKFYKLSENRLPWPV